eukprot:TRINITY_DN1159_c0_g1_i3.p1 TRINITY_DN1159_c0_g1~~TRINITY_DN1159_c0_g1_i3.p1  ORF type:complete len:191 (+),score=40.48 TRINITY_DN1159_c0_g1_i3:159-731(+)
MSKSIAIVIGVGPGLGNSVATRFAAEGYLVGLIARKKESVDYTAERIASSGGESISALADASDFDQLRGAIDTIKQEGDVSVLVFNVPTLFKFTSILNLDVEDYNQSFRIGVTSCLVAVQQVVSEMIDNEKGTILITGATAALRGGAKFHLLSGPKFALRSLAQSLARELYPKGIHVAHVIIDGLIDSEK